jgi:hypothetical protein
VALLPPSAATGPASPISLNWGGCVEAALVANLGRYRRYDYTSLRDLLRVVSEGVGIGVECCCWHCVCVPVGKLMICVAKHKVAGTRHIPGSQQAQPLQRNALKPPTDAWATSSWFPQVRFRNSFSHCSNSVAIQLQCCSWVRLLINKHLEVHHCYWSPVSCRYFSDRFPNLVMGVWVFALQELGPESHLGTNYWPGGPQLYTSFIAAYNHMHPRVQQPPPQASSTPVRARPPPAGASEEGQGSPAGAAATLQLVSDTDKLDGAASPLPTQQPSSNHPAVSSQGTPIAQPQGAGTAPVAAGVTSSGVPATLGTSTQVITSITLAESAPASIPLDNSSISITSKGISDIGLEKAASSGQVAPSSITTASSTAGSLGIPTAGGQASAGVAVIVGYEVDPDAAAADGGLGGGPGAHVREFPRR